MKYKIKLASEWLKTFQTHRLSLFAILPLIFATCSKNETNPFVFQDTSFQKLAQYAPGFSEVENEISLVQLADYEVDDGLFSIPAPTYNKRIFRFTVTEQLYVDDILRKFDWGDVVLSRTDISYIMPGEELGDFKFSEELFKSLTENTAKRFSGKIFLNHKTNQMLLEISY